MWVTLLAGVRLTCWMYLSSLSLSSLRLRPPLEVSLLDGELPPELLELELELLLLLVVCGPDKFGGIVLVCSPDPL